VLLVNESVEPETITAVLPQHEKPERVAEGRPEGQREQEGDDRGVAWELLLFPLILVVQATWMGFLVYWVLRALF